MADSIDILILFSEDDNRPEGNMQDGWVTQFKKFLEVLLQQVLGEKPSILLKADHDTITGGDLSKVSTMITIVSKSFINSGPCLDLVESYYSKIGSGAKKRVFKVYKSRVKSEELPTKLRLLPSYEFFKSEKDSGAFKDYNEFFGPEAERSYWMKLVDLAYDLHEVLIPLKGRKKEHVKDIDGRKTVYLAEVSHDLTVHRNIIRRELQRHGYEVLPDEPLPRKARELEDLVKSQLPKCTLSIHLVGHSYGEIPEGSELSVVDIQHRLATLHSKEVEKASKGRERFSRLIWILPNIKNISERQKSFIENIQRDLMDMEHAEILQTPLEDFKNIIREELIEISTHRRLGKALWEYSDTDKTWIYVIADKTDAKEAEFVHKMAKKGGFEVLTSGKEDDLMNLRQTHIENLRKLDAAIIFFGNVNEQWVRMKLLDLLKAPGFGRNKPILNKALVCPPGKVVDPSIFNGMDIKIIQGKENDIQAELESFMEELKEGIHG